MFTVEFLLFETILYFIAKTRGNNSNSIVCVNLFETYIYKNYEERCVLPRLFQNSFKRMSLKYLKYQRFHCTSKIVEWKIKIKISIPKTLSSDEKSEKFCKSENT